MKPSLTPLPFWMCLREDALHHANPEDRPAGGWARLCFFTPIALRSSGFHAAILYRLSHSSRAYCGLAGKALAAFFYWLGRHWYGCDLSPQARLYGGLILPHPRGIVVAPGVTVGPRAWIFQNVTLGGAPGKSGMPTIGADARIFTGAVISGPVTIGDNVLVGANTVISWDIPGKSVVHQPKALTTPLPRWLIPSEDPDS